MPKWYRGLSVLAQPVTVELRLFVRGNTTGDLGLRVIDIHGNVVQSYLLGVMIAGEQIVAISMSAYANGSYAVQMMSAGHIATVRVQVAR